MRDENDLSAKKMEIQDYPLWGNFKFKRVPVSFTLEITARCNLNCRHCYINLPAGDICAEKEELTVEEILNIGRQAVDMGAMWCLISGGEPLLRKDFADIFVGLKRLGLLVSVFTNGILINEEHMELFRKYPPRDIEMTVYGVTDKSYEAVTRKKGSFKKFKRNLELLKENGVRIRLKSMALRSNMHEQDAIADFCRSYTKDFYRFDPQIHLRFDGNPVRNAEIRAERLTPEEVVALEEGDTERIDSLRKNCKKYISDESADYAHEYLLNCGAGNGSFNVGYDGQFRLCSSLCAPGTTYDLRRGSLKEAWDVFVPEVRMIRAQLSDALDKCNKCSLVNLCMWCPAHAHLETGDLAGETSYYCEVAKKRAESILKGEKN